MLDWSFQDNCDIGIAFFVEVPARSTAEQEQALESRSVAGLEPRFERPKQLLRALIKLPWGASQSGRLGRSCNVGKC